LTSSGAVKVEIHNLNSDQPILLAKPKKANESKIILAGHIDVVQGEASQFSPLIKKGKIFGRGSFDMKGPLSALILAFVNLSKKENNLPLTLFISSDEEIGGWQGTNFALRKKLLNGKVAILPDGGEKFSIISQQKGPLRLEIIFKGISAHAAEPEKGTNPIIKLFSFFSDIEKAKILEGNGREWQTTIVPAKIISTNSLNQIPEQVSLIFDVRLTKPKETDKKLTLLLKLGQKHSATIKISKVDGLIFKVSPENIFIKSWLRSTSQIAHKRPSFIKNATSSDGRFFALKKIPTIITCPKGGNRHADKEWVDLKSLEKFRLIVEDFITKKMDL